MSSRIETSVTAPVIDILMYHSISDRDGPTNIAPAVFKAHMDAIKDAGVPVVTLDDLLDAHAGKAQLPAHSIIITFDDGFVDFADFAWPVMEAHGFTAIVYLPTGCMGGVETWRGALTPPRHLMDWGRVRELLAAGVRFGSHSVTHPDLDSLNARTLLEELRSSKQTLEDMLGIAIDHFAPPYGVADFYARSTVERLYKTSVGTRFERATLQSDLNDLPRLEMFYYANPDRWLEHVQGKGDMYMKRRQTMRYARENLYRPWERI